MMLYLAGTIRIHRQKRDALFWSNANAANKLPFMVGVSLYWVNGDFSPFNGPSLSIYCTREHFNSVQD